MRPKPDVRPLSFSLRLNGKETLPLASDDTAKAVKCLRTVTPLKARLCGMKSANRVFRAHSQLQPDPHSGPTSRESAG